MRARFLSIVLAMALLAPATPSLVAAQSGTPQASAPLKTRVQVPASGEFALLEGTVSIASSLSLAADGSTWLSYTCETAGNAVGENSRANYALSGTESGKLQITQSLPGDVGFSCRVVLAAPNVVQQFRITLQAALDANGAISSVVVRTIGAL